MTEACLQPLFAIGIVTRQSAESADPGLAMQNGVLGELFGSALHGVCALIEGPGDVGIAHAYLSRNQSGDEVRVCSQP